MIESNAGGCVARLACPRIILIAIHDTDLYDESCAASSKCPISYALDPDGKHCVESCASGKRVFDNDANEYVCVTECPTNAPFLDDTQTCVSCSHSLYPFWDPAAKVCVQKCPEATPMHTDAMLCRKCEASDGGEYWNG